jgi:small-conductance mechanosensitive channel
VIGMNRDQLFYSFGAMDPGLPKKLLYTLLLIFLLRLALSIVLEAIRPVRNSLARHRLKMAATKIIYIIGVLGAGRIWFHWMQPLMFFLGTVIAAIMIVAKDILIDLFGWVYIMGQRPFEAGDWVKLGEFTGEVAKVKLLHVVMLETLPWEDGRKRTGLIMQLPNRRIFSTPLINYSKGRRYVWNEVTIKITLNSNWRKAKELLQRIVERHTEHIYLSGNERVRQISERWIVFYRRMAPEIGLEVLEGHLLLTARFLCEPENRHETLSQIWEDVLEEFGPCEDIQFILPKAAPANKRLKGSGNAPNLWRIK